ncbi:MAG: protein translocase subunit SecD [Deltaproteobacteria bacterium]|nr:protein translocase subunit SecD [Deltaproteobacteria bacterium]
MTGDLKKRALILFAVIIAAFVFLAPTVFREELGGGKWISRPISLGLDLSGGVHLVYEVEAGEAVKSSLQAKGNAIRADLRRDKVAVTRARVNDKGQLELTLLSDRFVAQTKQKVQDNYRELSFVDQRDDSGKIILVFALNELEARKIERKAITDAVETLRNRVDQFGVAEPLIQNVGENRILLQMPGVSDIESVKKVVGSVAKLEFRLVPVGEGRANGATMRDRSNAPVVVEEDVLMTGDVVSDARVAFHEGQVEVSLSFTSEGGQLFRRITSENVGRNLSIILDGVVYSSPTIRETIAGGHASISGGFTMQEAKQLAVVLRAGALPAPLKVLEERTVGPSLGKESIRNGILSIIGGFVFIVGFMIVYYKKAGVVAAGSLILNMILIMAALSAFGATLSLPGLAGLALTIGMAVDYNVLIFERIRDELRNGAARDAAVSAGFERALSAIIDSNITTLITGLILYYFGTGPIRGFAVTLTVGILTTIFAATYASRICFDYFPLQGKKGLSV